MKKHLVWILVFVMLMSFVACTPGGGSGSTNTPAPTSASTTAASTAPAATDDDVIPPGQLPVVSEPTTLSYAMAIHTLVEDLATNELWMYLQEQTGVTFEYEMYPTDEFAAKIDLMMAAGGNDLPDVIIGNTNVNVRTNWGTSGFLVDLKPYYELLYYLPIAFDNCEYTDWETAVMQVTSPNGAIYGLPSYAESPNDRVSQGRINFYLPWVEQAGMLEFDEHGEIFTSMDKVLEYFELVKTGDFNGNGKQDEIPLTGYTTNTGPGNLKYALLPMFMKRNPDAWFIDTATNTVKYNFTTEEYREGLRFISDMYKKGYIDPMLFTQDATQMTAQITADPLSVASFLRISQSNLSQTTVPPSTDFAWASALSAPGETERYQYYGMAIPYIQYLVTSNCENVEAAVRVGDYWGSEEVSFINNVGFEGIDYDWASDLNDPKWDNPWDIPLEQTYVRRTVETGGRATWGTMQNVWMSNWGVSCLNYIWAIGGGFDKTLDTWPGNLSNAQRIMHNLTLVDRSNVLAGQVYTEDEIEINQDIYTPISTYANECFTLFATGVMDIETEWDSYVAELNTMGLQEVIDSENRCYDRMNK